MRTGRWFRGSSVSSERGTGHWAGAAAAAVAVAVAADDDLDEDTWSTGQLAAEGEDDCARFDREA